MASESYGDKKTLISEYNEAGFQIMRLHELWKDYSRYMRGGDIYSVHQTLENIWIELSADANEKHEGIINLLNKSISVNRKNQIKLAQILKLKAKKLKKLQEEAGKGGKKRHIDQDDMDE